MLAKPLKIICEEAQKQSSGTRPVAAASGGSLFVKLQPSACNLFKDFTNFTGTPILRNTSERLLPTLFNRI